MAAVTGRGWRSRDERQVSGVLRGRDSFLISGYPPVKLAGDCRESLTGLVWLRGSVGGSGFRGEGARALLRAELTSQSSSR
jgi:hypothetical protein